MQAVSSPKKRRKGGAQAQAAANRRVEAGKPGGAKGRAEEGELGAGEQGCSSENEAEEFRTDEERRAVARKVSTRLRQMYPLVFVEGTLEDNAEKPWPLEDFYRIEDCPKSDKAMRRRVQAGSFDLERIVDERVRNGVKVRRTGAQLESGCTLLFCQPCRQMGAAVPCAVFRVSAAVPCAVLSASPAAICAMQEYLPKYKGWHLNPREWATLKALGLRKSVEKTVLRRWRETDKAYLASFRRSCQSTQATTVSRGVEGMDGDCPRGTGAGGASEGGQGSGAAGERGKVEGTVEESDVAVAGTMGQHEERDVERERSTGGSSEYASCRRGDASTSLGSG